MKPVCVDKLYSVFWTYFSDCLLSSTALKLAGMLVSNDMMAVAGSCEYDLTSGIVVQW